MQEAAEAACEEPTPDTGAEGPTESGEAAGGEAIVSEPTGELEQGRDFGDPSEERKDGPQFVAFPFNNSSVIRPRAQS